MNGKDILRADEDFGLAQEEDVLHMCRKYFNEDIKTTSRYFKYDGYYESETKKIKYYEIKSRRTPSTQYSTTIFPIHKIKVLPMNAKLIIVFKFTDGTFFIEYNPIVFNCYSVSNIEYVRHNGEITSTPHYNIPMCQLIPLIPPINPPV